MNMTVLLACKDRAVNLKYCLASIHTANVRPKETILVDFGSDVSLEPYQAKYPWLTIIRTTKNTKVFHKARAFNIGLKHISNKFVCSTDVDQIFQPNFFNVVYKTLTNKPKQFVMCRTYFWKGALPAWLTPETVNKHYHKLRESLPTNAKRSGEGCCMAVATQWAKNVHGWDEEYIGYGAEDSDFMFRAMFSGFKRVWLQHSTSMIHLPHQKNTKYYSWDTYIKCNRQRFNNLKRKKYTIVNLSGNWGQL